MSSSSFLVS